MLDPGATTASAPARHVPAGLVIAGLVLAAVICDWLSMVFGWPVRVLIPSIQFIAVLLPYRIGQHYSLGQRMAVQIAPLTTLLVSAMARYIRDQAKLPDLIFVLLAAGGWAVMACALWLLDKYRNGVIQ